MRVACCTSISFSYLSRARVLAHTLKRHHPDWVFWICVTDREPIGFTFDLDQEPFDRVIWGDELPIDSIRGWLFKHDLVEACTAAKGPMLELLTRTDAERIFYLDPDIALLAPLQPLVDLLDRHTVLLTPHQVAPETTDAAIVDNELGSLRHGAYNLGFLAIRNDDSGRRIARWWKERLERFCYDDIPAGLFVDQRWCDLLPSLFEDVAIVRDPGYNVASWNISQRRVSIDTKGVIRAAGHPLRFFHFTKLGSVGEVMTQKYAGENVEIYELWSWYERLLERYHAPEIPPGWWHYGFFDNGDAITATARRLYRLRDDLQDAFPDPFAVGPDTFFTWMRDHSQALCEVA